jgi:3-hydroxy-9,10-secoandrosta-1,3,5(10)-triene-9,17-dione monooxygenase reductase component
VTPSVGGGTRTEDAEYAHFRSVLGHVPTAVTVITATAGGDPVGMAAGSFSSISLDPPLVGFFVAKTSTTWPRIQAAGRFCANVLGAHQRAECAAFARSGGDKFNGIPWSPTPNGMPRLDDVLAWVDCRIKYVYDAGDHELCIGLVEGLGVSGPADSVRSPLVFYRGGYGTIGELGDAVSGSGVVGGSGGVST